MTLLDAAPTASSRPCSPESERVRRGPSDLVPGVDFHPRSPVGSSALPARPHSAPTRRLAPLAARRSTLIAAPTGSGKTLAGFLMAINDLYLRSREPVTSTTGARVVYVSPLKALAVDIAQNLEAPLSEIASIAAEQGLSRPPDHGRRPHR